MTSTATSYPAAPELVVSQWFNTPTEITLEGLRGEVVVIEAFQMLCPGCVARGLPQTQRVQAAFGDEVRVLGLHTVFEHHEAMQPVSLAAFLHEYGIGFPVGVDRPEPGSDIPMTMQRYRLRGTPSLLLVDRAGRLRANLFGHLDDLELGALLARLIDEPLPPPSAIPPFELIGSASSDAASCDAEGCVPAGKTDKEDAP